MKVLTDCTLFRPEVLEKIEEHYQAKFVCETCLRDSDGNWRNYLSAIFYQDDPKLIPEDGSEHFALSFVNIYHYEGVLLIANAEETVKYPIVGVVADNGDVIYSRYRWDYRESPDGSVWIDGGRDYTRWGGRGELVTLKIVKGELKVVSGEDI